MSKNNHRAPAALGSRSTVIQFSTVLARGPHFFSPRCLCASFAAPLSRQLQYLQIIYARCCSSLLCLRWINDERCQEFMIKIGRENAWRQNLSGEPVLETGPTNTCKVPASTPSDRGIYGSTDTRPENKNKNEIILFCKMNPPTHLQSIRKKYNNNNLALGKN